MKAEFLNLFKIVKKTTIPIETIPNPKETINENTRDSHHFGDRLSLTMESGSAIALETPFPYH